MSHENHYKNTKKQEYKDFPESHEWIDQQGHVNDEETMGKSTNNNQWHAVITPASKQQKFTGCQCKTISNVLCKKSWVYFANVTQTTQLRQTSCTCYDTNHMATTVIWTDGLYNH